MCVVIWKREAKLYPCILINSLLLLVITFTEELLRNQNKDGCPVVHSNMMGPPAVWWATTKSQCNSGQSNGTGLEKHFKAGCSNYTGSGKSHMRITLLEHMDTTVERLEVANHVAGSCRCTDCGRLKDLEDKWILRLGSLHGPFGLNHCHARVT